jgi:Asp-tRNA(Asn)/Glu-tRNA(Gln) amidotransferase A subunit family amidase
MQLMVRSSPEQALFRTAAAYQSLTDWHQRYPAGIMPGINDM